MVTVRQKSRSPQKPMIRLDIYAKPFADALKRVRREGEEKRRGGPYGRGRNLEKESAGLSLLRKNFPLYCAADLFPFTLRCPGCGSADRPPKGPPSLPSFLQANKRNCYSALAWIRAHFFAIAGAWAMHCGHPKVVKRRCCLGWKEGQKRGWWLEWVVLFWFEKAVELVVYARSTFCYVKRTKNCHPPSLTFL